MAYMYNTVTVYRYKCQLCGTESSANTQNEIIRCNVCGVYLCGLCNHHNFCGNHWNALDNSMKPPMIQIEHDTKNEKKNAIILFALGLPIVLVGFIGGIIGIALSDNMEFFFLPFLLFFPLLILLVLNFVRKLQITSRSSKKQREFLELNNINLQALAQIPSGPAKGIQQPVYMVQNPVQPNISAPTQIYSPNYAEETIYCSHCGKPNRKTAKFCDECGSSLK